MAKTVDVAVSSTSYGYDVPYSYRVPAELGEYVSKGMRVLVPFGKGNRKRVALVLNVSESNDLNIARDLKPILSLIDEEPLVNDEMLEMVFWLKETTMCTYFEALKTIIPSGLNVNFAPKYELTGRAPKEDLTKEEEALYAFLLKAKNKKEFDTLLETSGNKSKYAAVEGLLQKGIIRETSSVKRKIKDETVKMVRLSEKYLDEPNMYKLSLKQKQAVDLLMQNSSASVKEMCYLCNMTAAVVESLCRKGIFESYEYEVVLPSNAQIKENVSDIVLSDEQNKVFEGISKRIEENKPKGILLHGVTGSGKTSVFIKLIDFTLKLKKQAIMLIPEISLTPQMVEKFQNLFGKTVAVIHSNLSLSQRLNEYKRIQRGDAQIVVGTRSAVFAPLKNIGLIIMDEEGEMTYKSDASPRYHARDVAKKRCASHNAVLLMASATPSVESYFFAKNGRYELFELSQRYSQSPLPDVSIVDMSEELLKGNSGFFSDVLAEEINYNLSHGEQSILLLNRRGYNTYISCLQCKEPVLCSNCNIPLTYHKINGRLICHYCGHSEPFEGTCRKCGSEHLKMTGFGTQKIEDEIQKLFPSARVLRMDTDTTYSRYAYEKKFKAFADGKYDIMIGTQMIAKGLDFPNVTLVGVLSVDRALFGGDFRSYERTFSLITQVVGRSGRGDKKGRAFLQTFVPGHYVLNLAANQDYAGFYSEEILIRKALIYPPFCDIFIVGFSSLVDSEADKASKAFLELIKKKAISEKVSFPLKVLGPSKCVYEKINGKYRYKMIIKCKNTIEFRKFIGEILMFTYKMREFSNVNVYIDINGDIL
ncbi:MAG: primosomal protein N' [Oscillospiraceae bacterium]|nr:primosomal protein N' [Oscillospiraceae bacterium]